MDLESILQGAGLAYRVRGKNTGANHINICCPFCGEDRFHCGIHKEKGWFKCFVCGQGGGWFLLAKQLNASLSFHQVPYNVFGGAEYITEESAESKEVATDKELCREFDIKTDAQAIKWLTGKPYKKDIKHPLRPRWLPDSVMRASEARMGINRLSGYIVWQQGGNTVARRYTRSGSGSKWWQKNEGGFVFGYDWCKKFSPKFCVLCEGVFDCLRLPIGSAAAVLGTAISDKTLATVSDMLPTGIDILLAFDRDAKPDMVETYALRLLEIGYNVKTLDWGKAPCQLAKDLDEIFVLHGQDGLDRFLTASLPSFQREGGADFFE